MDLIDTVKLPKWLENTDYEFVDLTDTTLQVQGSMVHLTQVSLSDTIQERFEFSKATSPGARLLCCSNIILFV